MSLGRRQLRREPHALWEQEVAGSNPVAPTKFPNYSDQHIRVANLLLNHLFKVRAERDGFGVDIHEDLLRIEIPPQLVAEPSRHPTTFLSTITDEDLAPHFMP